MLELRRAAPHEGGDFVVVALLAGALLTSSTHERRVAKMAGIAGETVYAETALVWRLVLVGLVAAAAAAISAPNMGSLFPVAMVVAGIGFAQWGAGAGFAWFVRLGAFMVGAGLVDVTLGAGSPSSQTLRLVVLGLALPAFGLETSRRFLWFRR